MKKIEPLNELNYHKSETKVKMIAYTLNQIGIELVKIKKQSNLLLWLTILEWISIVVLLMMGYVFLSNRLS